MARLMYGSGLRLLESLRLRVKDLDFARRELLVREGKGDKDRVTMLPASLEPDLLHSWKKFGERTKKMLRPGSGPFTLHTLWR